MAATGKSRDRGRLRASDSEREQVAGALQAAFVQGRLTQEELSARVEQTYAAKTYSDLTEVIADRRAAAAGTGPQPRQLIAAACSRPRSSPAAGRSG